MYGANFSAATESERAPLIRSYVQGLPSLYTESVGNFYSPQGSPEGSLDRFEQSPVLGAYPPVRFTRDQVMFGTFFGFSVCYGNTFCMLNKKKINQYHHFHEILTIKMRNLIYFTF